jgi:hypothetical protein
MWKKEEITMQTFENKTRLEALQLGAATNAECDKLIKEDKLPHRWHWTRTMAAYEKPNVPFNKKVSMKIYDKDETWELAVPKKYRGKANIVLLAEIGKKEVRQEGNMIILSPTKITAKPMPKEDGWHMPDEFGFPSGDESNNDNKDVRYLWRRTDGAFVGLLSRYDGWGGDWRDVYADGRGDGRCGVVISNPGTSGKTDCENCKRLEKENVELKEALAKIKNIVEAAKRC